MLIIILITKLLLMTKRIQKQIICNLPCMYQGFPRRTEEKRLFLALQSRSGLVQRILARQSMLKIKVTEFQMPFYVIKLTLSCNLNVKKL